MQVGINTAFSLPLVGVGSNGVGVLVHFVVVV